MNLAETHDLLVFAASVDNRRIDDTTVAAWQTILADIQSGDAMRAVRDHFAQADAYLMPVHVRTRALAYDRARRRAEREAREAAEEAQLAIERGPVEDRSEDVTGMVIELRDVLAPGDPDKLRWGTKYWRGRHRRNRQAEQEPNPHFKGLPPPEGFPVPGEPDASTA